MAEDGKLFDVAKPGKSVPDPTSRPIIVGHGTRMKHDPMMQDNEKTADTEIKKTEPTVQPGKTVIPATEATPSLAKSDDFTPGDSDDNPSDAAVVSAIVDQASSNKKQDNDDGLSQEAKAQRQHIDRLITEKTYFLPIGHVTRKKKAQNSMIGLLLLLMIVAAGGFFAYQTGLLKGLL